MSKGDKVLEKRENPPRKRSLAADDLGRQFQIGTRPELACTPKWADLRVLKQLIPRGLRVVPRISQVFENGIVSAYVSRLAQSK
jgi:hypothetical protein